MRPQKQKYRITVALPVYNGGLWIKSTLQSLMTQTHKSFMIDIVDDGSSDNTVEICKEYAKKYSNIRISQNKVNIGGHLNFAKILDRCQTEYIVWACQDDYWCSNFLTSLEGLLEGNENCVLAQGNIVVLRENGEEQFFRSDFLLEGTQGSAFNLAKKVLLPRRNGNWEKNNLFLHGLARTAALQNAFWLLGGSTPGHDRILLFYLTILGDWASTDTSTFFKRAGVGERIRENKKFDPIRLSQKNVFSTWQNGYLMARGLYMCQQKCHGTRGHFLGIIFLYIILWDLHLLKSFLAQRLLKQLISYNAYNFIKYLYNKIW